MAAGRALVVVAMLLAIASLSSATIGFWCSGAPSSPQDRRPNKDVLTVASFNAEWLFLNATGKCPGGMCPWETEAEAWDHLNVIAGVIRGFNADIVNVPEVQDCNTLSALADAIGSEYNYRVYLVQGTDTATGQNVGLLTRVDPIVDLQRYQEGGKDVRAEWPVSGEQCKYGQQGGYTSVSKHYYTRISLTDSTGTDAGVVTLVGMHFLAFPTDAPRCAQREGQAMVMQQLIMAEINAGHEVIAFGDLNDYDGVVLDANKDVPTSRVLQFLKTPGLVATSSAINPSSTRYSSWYDKNGDCELQIPSEVSTIDHLLCSPVLFQSLTSAYYVHDYVKECNPPNYESDHWPVLAVFDVSQLAAKRASRRP